MIKKLTYLLIILILLELAIGFIYLNKPAKKEKIVARLTPKEAQTTLSLSPQSGNLKVNQIQEVKILVDAQEKILTGIDAIIKYDPEILAIDSAPVPGKIFPVYPILRVKEAKGEISVTATVTDPNQPLFSGPGQLASFIVRPLKEGKATLAFDFTPGKSNDSNFAEKETGNDVLEKVVNAVYNIKP